MSPHGVSFSTGVEEFGISIVDRNLSFERFNELDFGPGEAEALRLGRDLEAAAVPLHDVVVADDPFMGEAADALDIFPERGARLWRCRGPSADGAGDERAGVACVASGSVAALCARITCSAGGRVFSLIDKPVPNGESLYGGALLSCGKGTK